MRKINSFFLALCGFILSAIHSYAQPQTHEQRIGPPPPDSPYGVDMNLILVRNELGLKQLPVLLAGLSQAGIGYVRIGLDWSAVEPQPGVWNFTQTDRIVQTAARYHMRVLAELGGTPRWASTAPATALNPWDYPPQNWNDWSAYVTQLARRYHGMVMAWKVLNEPVLLNRRVGGAWPASTYARALGLAYRAVHREDPDAAVMSGCVWWDDPATMPNSQYYHALVTDPTYPLYKNIDIMNLHYNDIPPKAQAKWLVDLHRVMRRDAGKELPIWVDEVAYPASPSEQNDAGYKDGEESQAKYLTDTLAVNFADPQVKKVFWTFPFDGPSRTHGPVEYTWGLYAVVRSHVGRHGVLRPRPSLHAYAAYIRAHPTSGRE
ncbi:beta-1,4-xylanase [Chthonomonas calidirosea]|uniref:Beta-1,4-xylanase n=1 Tax=Chthonomonas calidirosea (strain DSM 23976 / ICMP 18418 / T49) TaxID=1303518 RepID=S0EU61_CHTCT|nr:endo-1,4-beta-xylanase [Chthonomonas calidirosea]CCW35154.1 Beta-1,4-xylanase [Chthonomonas calidirosea T49]CEK20829.1 beta-1,4-xylanase [Chthonomonas calidirosea]